LADWLSLHPHLYHYTSEVGLKGIIESNSIWATSFEHLNDAQEIIELKEPLTTALAGRFAALVASRAFGRKPIQNVVAELGGEEKVARSLAESWTKALYTATFDPDEAKRNLHCCIASFCSHASDQEYERDNGLLSQWRGYGGNGGYCLVFDSEQFVGMCEKEKAAYQYTFLDFMPAHYRRDEPVADVFPELFEASAKAVDAALNKKTPETDLIFNPFVAAATRTRHCGFYEEREIRLVACVTTEVADKKIRHLPEYVPQALKPTFRVKHGDREKMHVAVFDKAEARLPLVKVLVGPSAHQLENKQRIEKIIPKGVPIHLSEPPFIG
jgi:Protein of unknown function (DUF2971)